MTHSSFDSLASPASGRLAHHRLHVYHAALELFVGVEEFARSIPRGFADLKDQVRRASASAVLNIAEGANRSHPRDKAARFTVARGEVGECDAALEMAGLVGIGTPDQVARLRQLADRTAAMLTGLIRRQRSDL